MSTVGEFQLEKNVQKLWITWAIWHSEQLLQNWLYPISIWSTNSPGEVSTVEEFEEVDPEYAKVKQKIENNC